jgi:PAS domain S-box-containing protein
MVAIFNPERKSGISILGDVPWGTHLCYFYQTKQDLVDILVPYFKTGLENNEFCMWVISEPLTVEEARAELQRAVKDLDQYNKKGQIELLHFGQWYTRAGKFDPDKVLRGCLDKERQARENGFEGLRISGSTIWTEHEEWNSFSDYEATVNNEIHNYHMLAICSYCLDKCDPQEIMDVFGTHQFALVGRDGKQAMIESAERKRAEEALRESEERFRAIVENAPFGYYRVGRDGLWQYVNPVWERMHGLSSEEVIGKPFEITQPPDSVGEARELVKRALAGETIVGEFSRLTREGNTEYHSFNIQPVKHRAGIVGIEGFINDITERRRMEEALRASEELYRVLFERNLAGIMQTSLDGRILNCNEAFARIFGYASRDELMSRRASDLWFDPAGREAFVARIQGEATLSNIELRLRRKDGQPVWVLENLSVVKRGEGQDPILEATMLDITERKGAEEALRESEERFRSLVENATVGIYRTTPDGHILMANPALVRMLGFDSFEELAARNLEREGFESSYPRSVFRERIEREGQVIGLESAWISRDGSVNFVRESGRAVRADDGRVLYYDGIVEDITTRRHAEEGMRRLSGRLLRLQDEERRRIARELHETAAQDLAALVINLNMVKDSAPRLSPRASACLAESLELAEQCSREIRTLSYLLHPPLVDEAGLAPALRWYTAGFAQRSGIEVHVEVSPEFGRLPSEFELTLYRIVQEALTNIHLHSGSKTARIFLQRWPNGIVLTVADEGHGFPSAALGTAGPESTDIGVGIPGMRERLRQLGGRLHIQSGSRGTTLRAILPLGEVTNGQTTHPTGG